MASLNRSTEAEARPDLSLLSEMVGMRKGLAVMVAKGVLPTPATVLALMESEKAIYASDGGFIKKDQLLGQIITAFQSGTFSVDDILKAVGIDPKVVKVRRGFFKRLFGAKP